MGASHSSQGHQNMHNQQRHQLHHHTSTRSVINKLTGNDNLLSAEISRNIACPTPIEKKDRVPKMMTLAEVASYCK